MEIENVRTYSYEDFIESNPMTGVDDMELVKEETPSQLKKDNRGFAIAGIVAAVAGVATFVGTNFASLFPFDVNEFMPVVIGAGLVSLGFGVVKAFRKIFRKKNLNLPNLQIRRKAERKAKSEVQAIETFRPGKKLTKSRTDSVIMGVCGGLAKHSGISSSMIRLAFIAAFAFTGGAAAILYGLLGFFLPVEDPEPSDSQRPRGRGPRRALRP